MYAYFCFNSKKGAVQTANTRMKEHIAVVQIWPLQKKGKNWGKLRKAAQQHFGICFRNVTLYTTKRIPTWKIDLFCPNKGTREYPTFSPSFLLSFFLLF